MVDVCLAAAARIPEALRLRGQGKEETNTRRRVRESVEEDIVQQCEETLGHDWSTFFFVRPLA
jgi:hypothetical protein